MSEFLTPTEVMQALNMTYSSFLRRVKDHTIPHKRFGAQIRIPKEFISEAKKEAWAVLREDSKDE